MIVKLGIDEVNYSPSLAGPCIIATFFLAQNKRLPTSIKDSKVVKEKKRILLYNKLCGVGNYVIAVANPSDIQLLGIYQARNQAAFEAVNRSLLQIAKLYDMPTVEIHADKSMAKALRLYTFSYKKLKIMEFKGGDKWVWSASILAKTFVDALFYGYANFYPK